MIKNLNELWLKATGKKWKKYDSKSSSLLILLLLLLLSARFFPPLFLLEFEGQQVSSGVLVIIIIIIIISHWSLSDSKSLQVSKTRLSILVDLDNDVVLMVSFCPLIFKTSSSFTKVFRDCLKSIKNNRCHHHLYLHISFLVLRQDLSTDLFFRFILFSLLWNGNVYY